MAKLALALGADAIEDVHLIPVDFQTSRAVFAALGTTLLLYQLSDGGRVAYEAIGIVSKIEAGSSGQRYCRLRDIVPFSEPIYRQRSITRRDRRMLALQPAEFDDVLGEARTAAAHNYEISEARGALYRPPHVPTTQSETYLAVLAAYGYRCAVTGKQLSAAQADGQHMVYVRGEPHGVAQRNLMPMTDMAAKAWRAGLISATDDYRVMAILGGLDPDLLAAMHNSGRLQVPGDPDFDPDPANIAWHRAHRAGA